MGGNLSGAPVPKHRRKDMTRVLEFLRRVESTIKYFYQRSIGVASDWFVGSGWHCLAEIFTSGLHYPTYLAEKVIFFSKLRGEGLGRLQKLAIHRFHGERIFDLRPEVEDISDSAVLTAYFQFFDELFFFGSLGGSKRFILKFDSRLAEEGGPRGKFSKREVLNVQDGKQGQIFELLIYRQRGENRYYSLRAALGFMLQGWAWQDMALAIKDAVSDRHFVNLDIPLGRIEMLADSLAVYPAFLKDEQLRKWRIDPKRLAKMAGRK
ncbi:hypothetical protein BKA61DRAFT_700954 [Leptodontidium sp. MPI-SDFR-AT-0119]|nr:hypothetical protein BKA61DRAFT_700954 [Leptodontidium sp. MPI-SDFR-AT-0119]